MKYVVRLFGLIGWVWLTGTLAASGQHYGGYAKGQKITYTPSSTQVLVQFSDSATLARRQKSPATLGAQRINALPALPSVALLEVGAGKSQAAMQQLVAQLRRDAEVVQAAPVLLNAAGEPFGGMTDQFIVKLKPTTSLADLQGLLKQTGAVLHHAYEFDPLTYFLAVDKSKGDALTMANRFL